MGFVGDGEEETLSRIQDTFSRYSMDTFTWSTKKRNKLRRKAAQSVLTNRVIPTRAPDVILSDMDARVSGGDFRDFVMSTTPLYNQLFLGFIKV